ncbi:MAG TPA: hypothetical protein ENN34_04785 [Deltaproteobacteria bacterium]|nr:hypothetical protein [Deltaproteobacteria bacterium]
MSIGFAYMNAGDHRQSPLLESFGDQFRLLIRNLARGNRKKAELLAEEGKKDISVKGISIVSQDLIEKMAQSQAIRNSLINSPSIVPGIGTIISLALVSIENFFVLDQSITLIMALCHLRGCSFFSEDSTEEEFIIQILGEAFGIADEADSNSSSAIVKNYVTGTLPRGYLNKGLDRGMRRLMTRFLPSRRKSRILPGGIGLIVSAAHAYDTVVRVGISTLKHITRMQAGSDSAIELIPSSRKD